MKRVLVAGMVVMAAACGGKSPERVANAAQLSVAGDSVHINCGPWNKDSLRKDEYTITIKKGQTVTWMNDYDRVNRDVKELQLVDKNTAAGNGYLSIQKLMGNAGPVSLPYTLRFDTPGRIKYALKFKCTLGWMIHTIDPDIIIAD